MKNLFLQVTSGLALMLAVAACKKDETQVVIQPGAAPTVTASANNLVLLQDKATDKAVTYTWTPASFGYQAAVTYTLQFDKKGGDFSAPVSFNVGNSLIKSLTVSELNSIYVGKKLVGTPPAPTPLDVRVKATVGETAPASISPVTTITATPYNFCDQPAKAWSIIGPAGVSWDMDITMTFDCASGTYMYVGPLKADEFKFRYGKAWDTNLGGKSSTGGALTQGGDNLKVTTAGTYTVTLSPVVGSDGKATGTFTIK